MRRSWVALAVSAVAIAIAAGTASTAQGFSGGPGSPITDAAYKERVKAIIGNLSGTPSTPSGYSGQNVLDGMMMGRGRTAMLPTMARMAGASVAASGALTVGQIIGDGLGAAIYRKLTGGAYNPGAMNGTVIWNTLCAGSVGTCTNSSISVTGFPTVAPTAAEGVLWYPTNLTVGGQSYCNPPTTAQCTTANTYQLYNALMVNLEAGSTVVQQTTAGTPCGVGVPFTVCRNIYRNVVQMERAGNLTATDATGYGATNIKVDNSVWNPPAPTDDDYTKFLTDLGALLPGTGTDAQEATIKAINQQLTDTPAVPESGTIELPAPEPDETASDYRTRLVQLGWLGTLTVVNYAGDVTGYPDYDPRYGPDTPVRIKIGTTGSTIPFPSLGYAWPGPGPAPGPDPVPNTWPDPNNPPKIGPKTPIQLTKNPATFGGGLVPPVTPPGGGCGSNAVGSLDITPITGLDYGDHFPFGLFSWAGTQLSIFDVGPTAPSWAINVPAVGADYEIDLDPFSPYMATMRTVLAWVLWIGTVWAVATSLLGVRGVGNPAGAVDDYLDEII